MKHRLQKRLLLRVAKTLAAIVILPIFALAPVYVASVMLTDRQVDPNGSSEIFNKHVDVADIDENGTVMYTVSPHDGHRTNTGLDFTVPSDLLKDSDLIRVTVSSDDGEHSFFDAETNEDCHFTLHLTDAQFDATKTETFTGYLRMTEEEFVGDDRKHPEYCGLYLSFVD